MSKPDAPSPPDFVGAAQQTGQSNIAAAIIQRLMSQTGSNTPWGSLRWNQTGTQHVGPGGTGPNGAGPSAPGGFGPGQMPDFSSGGKYGTESPAGSQGFDIPTFESNVTLSPEQQAIFDSQQANQLTSSNAAGQLLGGLDTSPIDFSGLPGLPSTADLEGTRSKVADAIYSRQSRYLDPQFAQSEEAERTRLANQGFQTGTEGFDKALGNFNLSKQRAYGDARDAALSQAGTEMSRDFGIGLSGRQQGISELLAQRQLPLNMIAALQGGQQVGMPQFPGAPGGQGIPGTDYSGAVGQQNQSNLANYANASGQYNSQMGGLYGLGSAALMSYLMAGASDRRLKRNIHRIAEHPLGIGVYSFEYLNGQPAIGVMADEVERVLPQAVAVHPSGYKMVNYKMLAYPTVDMVS